MKYLFARGTQSLIERFAHSRTLVAVDFDGTLAPIVSRPDSAKMRASTCKRFEILATRYPCAVISGRSRTDVKTRMAGVPLVAIIGNHGLEPSEHMREHAATVRAWQPILKRMLEPELNLEIENKRYSIAIHYRRAKDKAAASALIRQAVAALPDVRIIEGKQVVNVVPLGAPHKGIALEWLRDEVEAETAIYIGDDVTDEDVFALEQPERLLSIRIGNSRVSKASYYVREQAEIDLLFDRLLALRPA